MTELFTIHSQDASTRGPTSYYVIDLENIVLEASGSGEPLVSLGSSETSPANLVGTDFLSHISGEVTRLFFQTKISCLRDLERAEAILYRADKPDTKRYLRMTIAPDGDGRMVIYSTLLQEVAQTISVRYRVSDSEGAEAQPVWDRCAICGNIGRGHGWHDAFDFGVSAEYLVKYDICRNCSAGFSLVDLWE